jgi:hypothetical protein
VAIEGILSASSLGRKVPGRSMRYAAASVMFALGGAVAIMGSAPLRAELAALPHHVAVAASSVSYGASVPLLRRVNLSVHHSFEQAVAVLDSKPKAVAQVPAAELVKPEADNSGEVQKVAENDTKFPQSAKVEEARDAEEVLSIEQALKNDKPVLALELARKAAKEGCKSPALYRHWVEAASRTGAWGEAHRAAKRLVLRDESDDNVIFLAQLERRMGRNEAARRTLTRLLEKSPENASAQALLSRFSGNQRVAMR